MRRAYAPYSDYPVGAAGLVDDGRLVVGCNVENASYGVGAVRRVRDGLLSCTPPAAAGSPTSVCVNRDGDVIMPCGRCRQLLFENGGPEMLLLTVSGVRPMGEVLPGRVRSRCARRVDLTAPPRSSPTPTRSSPRSAGSARGRLARAVRRRT